MKEKKQPTIVDVLRYMKKLLRQGWTQGEYARSANGRRVQTHSQKAVRFCLYGARDRAADDLKCQRIAAHATSLLFECVQPSDIISFNDAKGRKKEEVLAVVDCAIKRAATR